MKVTSPDGVRMLRGMAAILADPRSWVGGVVPEEIKPYLGSFVSTAPSPAPAALPVTPSKRQKARPR